MQKQVVIIGGGNTFDTYEAYVEDLKNTEFHIERCISNARDWKPWLRSELEEEYLVIQMAMPSPSNAQYDEWKIWFEKVIPFLEDGVALIGHSLGGTFLVKYLSENMFPKKIESVHLVAACFESDSFGNTLASFVLPEKLSIPSDAVFFYHSKDDPIVPFEDLARFGEKIVNAHLCIFENYKHFNQEKFPELLKNIRIGQ